MKKIILICLALMTVTMGAQAQKRKSKDKAEVADTVYAGDVEMPDSVLGAYSLLGGVPSGNFPAYPAMYTIKMKTKLLLFELIENACVADLAEVRYSSTPESGMHDGIEFHLPFKVEREKNFFPQDGAWPVTIDTLLSALTDAFETEYGKAYSYGNVRAGSTNALLGTTTGNDMSSFKQIIPSTEYNYMYLEIKKPDSPTSREFYCVSWRQLGDETCGYFDFITSKRPDLIEEEEARAKERKEVGHLSDGLSDFDVVNKLQTLEKLAKHYRNEINDLTNELVNADRLGLGSQYFEIKEQITDYRAKLKEVVDRMHQLIMSEVE